MRHRWRTALAALAALGVMSATVVVAAACGSDHDVEFWNPFTDREAEALDQIVKDFQATHPKIKVKVKSAQDDGTMTQAIGAGKGPDVGLSYSTDIVGKFCASGAWINLNTYLQKDQIDVNKMPPAVRQYTEFRGTRCAMPALADAYGLYYNKDMFDAAGIKSPPTTLAELTAAAKKLTKRDADGTIKVAGFLPEFGFYENTPAHMAPMVNAKWLSEDGKSSVVGSDPAWQELLTWQKELVDWYGYDQLEKFRASLGDEFSDANAFQKGQVAINLDAEFRIAFIKDQAKDLKFGVAPLPVNDQARYGSGYITGNVIGISKHAKKPDAAWELVKYLTANTSTIVQFSNAIKNIPTTSDALNSPDLQTEPEFKTFISIFNHPRSSTTPPSTTGNAYQEKFQEFLNSWQAGKVKDLAAGLKDVDNQINATLQLGA
jgi:multiple sugar transport system substrate-binding protein